MTHLIQVDAVAPMIVTSLLVSVGIVMLFSLGVAGTDFGAGDRPGSRSSTASRLVGRSGAVMAFALFAAVLVTGIAVMLTTSR